LKNVEEKNQESPEEAENLANYSAKDGECTYIIFLHIFSIGIFKQRKNKQKINEERKSLANYSATSGDCLEFFCLV
jgi:hypothetical protein